MIFRHRVYVRSSPEENYHVLKVRGKHVVKTRLFLHVILSTHRRRNYILRDEDILLGDIHGRPDRVTRFSNFVIKFYSNSK